MVLSLLTQKFFFFFFEKKTHFLSKNKKQKKIRMERFSQHHVDQLNLKKSALETFKADYPQDPVQKIRSHLGSMGITGKLALQPIYTVKKFYLFIYLFYKSLKFPKIKYKLAFRWSKESSCISKSYLYCTSYPFT